MTPTPACRKASVRSFVSVALVLATASLPARLAANTDFQSLDFRLNANLAAAELHFAPFNAALGTLEQVEISFVATRRHAWGIWNVSGSEAAVPYDVTLSDTTLTLELHTYGFTDLHYGPTSTPNLTPTAFPAYLLQFLAGRDQFLAGNDPDFSANAYQPATTTTDIAGSFAPATFDGVLNLAYSFNPGIFTIASDGFFSGSLVDVYGIATVAYTYTPVAVPEPAAGPGMLAFTWIGLAVVSAHSRDRRRRESPSVRSGR